ncbi:Putative uncharacterized protein [Moritella viscosa]|uniref:hypothetical protein n=1 Tax=Moritella viscosa TaxID=80854 RepID=UPI000921091C|nr:hypothetical protein [Moritella viscosa]SGZ07483.1 Putative uncharacterized protein [Moritella viscosa]
MKQENLETNGTDALVASTKSVLGVVPFAGPLLSELIGSLIPNQRIDRLTKYVKQLEIQISSIENSKVRKALDSSEGVDLIEEGFVQASRSLTHERIDYVASVVANGIDSDMIEYSESKYLLKLLQELNEQEIIWLRSYLSPLSDEGKEFREKNKNVLEHISAPAYCDARTSKSSSLQRSYKEHLERIGLISPKYRMNREKNMPKFDIHTGRPSILYRDITSLGKLLLNQIGIYDPNHKISLSIKQTDT